MDRLSHLLDFQDTLSRCGFQTIAIPILVHNNFRIGFIIAINRETGKTYLIKFFGTQSSNYTKSFSNAKVFVRFQNRRLKRLYLGFPELNQFPPFIKPLILSLNFELERRQHPSASYEIIEIHPEEFPILEEEKEESYDEIDLAILEINKDDDVPSLWTNV